MPRVDVVVESKIEETFRVKKVRGMFDLKLEDGKKVEVN